MGNWEFYDQHFGPARLGHYLAFTGGDKPRAMELYRWSAAVSAVFWESFAYFEVAFRNAIDRRMCQRQTQLGRSGHWVFDDARELGRDAGGQGRHRRPYVDIDEARHRVRRNRKGLSSGQIISELSFGFWHQMVSKKQTFLWPDLVSAFPHAPNRNLGTIHDPVSRLRGFRNRIGHHHRVWSEDIAGRYADLLDVSGFLDPALRTFIDRHSRVPMMLAHRP